MDVIKSRLDSVEEKLFGLDETGADDVVQVLPFLTNFAKNLGNGVEKRDRIEPLLRKTSVLSSFLDPQFGEEVGSLSLSEKASIILAQENRVRRTGELWEKVEKRKSVLDQSQQLQDSMTHHNQQKLMQLAKIQIEQEEEGQTICEETLDLVQQYNDIMESLSQSFIQYDVILTKAEKEVQETKTKK